MGNWNAIHSEIEKAERDTQEPNEIVRNKYLRAFANMTGRNAIAYYSGWLQKTAPSFNNIVSINDEDKNGFMACFHGLDFSKGVDLILHSPGGQVAATESIIAYIRSKFKNNVRTFVPQLAMSGGTMMALCGREIWMGSHSNLGPIDPQFGSQPARLVLDEFDRAKTEIAADPRLADVWRPILEQITPTFLSTCENAIRWSKEIAVKTLKEGMFISHTDRDVLSEEVADKLSDVAQHKNHARHLHRNECEALGLVIKQFEDDQRMQDAILSVHHAFILSLMNTPAAKMIQNQNGIMFGKAVAT